MNKIIITWLKFSVFAMILSILLIFGKFPIIITLTFAIIYFIIVPFMCTLIYHSILIFNKKYEIIITRGKNKIETPIEQNKECISIIDMVKKGNYNDNCPHDFYGIIRDPNMHNLYKSLIGQKFSFNSELAIIYEAFDSELSIPGYMIVDGLNIFWFNNQKFIQILGKGSDNKGYMMQVPISSIADMNTNVIFGKKLYSELFKNFDSSEWSKRNRKMDNKDLINNKTKQLYLNINGTNSINATMFKWTEKEPELINYYFSIFEHKIKSGIIEYLYIQRNINLTIPNRPETIAEYISIEIPMLKLSSSKTLTSL